MKGGEIKVIAPLEKFECAKQNINLSENLRIRKVSDKERELILDTEKYTPRFLLSYGRVETLKYGLETSYSRAKEDINAVVSALRSYKAGRVGCNVALILDPTPGFFYSGGLITRVSFPVFGQKYLLTEAEVGEFKRFWNKFKAIDTTKKELKFLDTAIRRFNCTYERERYDDRLIDYITSFESLFLTSEQELGYKLSLRVAVMLAEESGKRKDIFQDMKIAYDLRCGIVHGRDLGRINNVVKKRFGSFEKLSAKMEDYLRKSIRAFYEKASREYSVKNIKDKIIDNLHEGVFDTNH